MDMAVVDIYILITKNFGFLFKVFEFGAHMENFYRRTLQS